MGLDIWLLYSCNSCLLMRSLRGRQVAAVSDDWNVLDNFGVDVE